MHSQPETLYSIAATFSGHTVVLDDCRRWEMNPGRRAFFHTFAEAEKVYRRLIRIGTVATNIVIIGE